MKRYDTMPDWLKSKGYLHLSPSLKIGENWQLYKKQIQNVEFIAKYAFYPLIHSYIKERKYKRTDPSKHSNSGRAHKHTSIETGATEQTSKVRPLHYSSHYDSLIYGYYANLLNIKYEDKLSQIPELSQSVTAYRKIKIENNSEKGKSTIHFAKEVFDQIIIKCNNEQKIAVLTFDIKGFFSSLDHQILKENGHL